MSPRTYIHTYSQDVGHLVAWKVCQVSIVMSSEVVSSQLLLIYHSF